MTQFSDLNLDPKVLQAVAESGYTTPTPIQIGAIPPALAGRDVLGIAQTGTGKTAGFVLPMITLLQRGRARARMPRSLVLCPTRELAAQVAENFDKYAKYLKLSKALLIGGVSFKDQDTAIDRGVDVLIATPGRLLDHFERGKLLLTGVQIMVVDEADRMLDMGFIPDIERIFNLTPFTRQTLFFSATMAPEIERITNTFLHSPARVEVARAASAGENITQAVVMFRPSKRENEASEKRAILRGIIDAEGEACSNAIIFCNRKTDVDIVAKSLKKNGYNAEPIHGDLEQSQRTRTLDGFRDGKVRFLVASDVAARGLDIPAVSHVFNFDVPSHAEDYVHRIGRTGRAGRSGKAFTICVPKDEKNLDASEKLVQTTIPRAEPPAIAVAPARADDAAPARDDRRERRERPDRPARNAAPRAETADRPEKADRPARQDRRKPERRAEPEVETVAAAPAEVQDTAPAPVPDRTRDQTRDQTRDRPRRDRGEDRNDNRIVGMGDDVPTFIAMSFAERRTG
jgi:superfamily II DNA/RNA helicase